MIELAGGLVLLGGVAGGMMLSMSERAKIERCFRNLDFSIKEGKDKKYPTFKKRKETDEYTSYEYFLPLGLIVMDKLGPVLSKTLGKHVEATGERYMDVKVYKGQIPSKWNYNDTEALNWSVPIGKGVKGVVEHDFDKIPHMTVAGTTRYGKTVLLKNIMGRLVEQNREDAEFYLIDLKGGLEFGRYERLNNVKGRLATNGEEALVMLEEIKFQMEEMMWSFRQNYISNVVGSMFTKRHFIIVDEAAQLTPGKFHSKSEAAALNKCQAILSEIARIGGGLGYRLIYCTQYPTADTLPRQIKMNADAKVSFKLGTGYASEVALDERGAEKLEGVGRCIYKTVSMEEVQVPWISDKQLWDKMIQCVGEVEHVKERDAVAEVRRDIITYGDAESGN